MIPVARTNSLRIQVFKGEIVVYDLRQEKAICLNVIAALIWQYCNGKNTIIGIAKLLEKEINSQTAINWHQLVWLSIEQLEHFSLIDRYLQTKSKNFLGIQNINLNTDLIESQNKLATSKLIPFVTSFLMPKSKIQLTDD